MAEQTPTRFQSFDRDTWSQLRASTPMTLSDDDLLVMQGLCHQLSLSEVEDIYLPVSRLLNLYVEATQQLHQVSGVFLGDTGSRVPYVIGIAGSVAVGKSTTARVLQALLLRWPSHPSVDLVTTDGFLFPNNVLDAQGLMERKGFPESYDRRRLLGFLDEVKSGVAEARAPVYSHDAYDIVPDEHQVVARPDILIVEGLNILQASESPADRSSELFVSDLLDFSIYVDAAEPDIERWYLERFLALRRTAFRDEKAFFHAFAAMSDADAVAVARSIWRDINGRNLRENILPTRDRARLVLTKDRDHAVQEVRLRRL